MKTAVIVILCVCALAILISMLKSRHFLPVLLLTALQGLCALFCADFIADFIPVSIGINPYTLTASALGGIPGVIFILISSIFLR